MPEFIPVSDEENHFGHAVIQAIDMDCHGELGEHRRLAFVRAYLDDTPVVVLVMTEVHPDGLIDFTPLAMMLTEDVAPRLTPFWELPGAFEETGFVQSRVAGEQLVKGLEALLREEAGQ